MSIVNEKSIAINWFQLFHAKKKNQPTTTKTKQLKSMIHFCKIKKNMYNLK